MKELVYICNKNEKAQKKAQNLLFQKGYCWSAWGSSYILFKDEIVVYFANDDKFITYANFINFNSALIYTRARTNCPIIKLGFGEIETE
jgi:hypothetical protein